MSKEFYIIHKWDGSSNSDWIPWLKKELENRNHKVTVFDMPNSENPKIKEWILFLENNIKDINQNTFFISHSIGCQATMRFLEKQKEKIGGVFFVAGWFNLENLENKEVEEIAKPWIESKIDFDKIKKVLPWSIVFLSDNDNWVSFEITKNKFESYLNSQVLILKERGHFEQEKFPELLEKIKEII